MAQLTEEVGEVARIIARRYGEQSEKESDKNKDLGEELADVLFVVLCSFFFWKYVENLFVMNYHWNSSKIKQIYGRIERLTKHVDLPINERIVNKYIYIL